MSALTVLETAIKEVPFVKYALGIAGIAAAISLVNGFITDPKVAVPSIIIMLALMVLLYLFNNIGSIVSTQSLQKPIQVLIWVIVFAFSMTLLLLLSAYFFNWPTPVKDIGALKRFENVSIYQFFNQEDGVIDAVSSENLPIKEELSLLLQSKSNMTPVAPVIRIAIPDLYVKGASGSQPVGGVISDFLFDYLRSNATGFTVVERKSLTNLNQVLKDKQGEASVVEISTAALAAGADIVLSGYAAVLSSQSTAVRLEVVNVKSQQQLAIQVCEQQSGQPTLNLVTECLGPAIFESVAQINQKSHQDSSIALSKLTNEQKFQVAQARAYIDQGKLMEAQLIYSEVMTTPSNDWRAEIDYLLVMNAMGFDQWVIERATFLLENLPRNKDTLCYRAQLMNELTDESRTVDQARKAIVAAGQCGDNVLLAEALLHFSQSVDHMDLNVSRYLVAQAKQLLSHEPLDNSWLKCEIQHHEYVVFNSWQNNWLGARWEKFVELGDYCAASGNIPMAVLAYTNSGVTAWDPEQGHGYYLKALELARQAGGKSYDDAQVALSESFQKKRSYVKAEQSLIDVISEHISAIQTLEQPLPASFKTLETEFLTRVKLDFTAPTGPALSNFEQLKLQFHLRQLANAIDKWGNRTEQYSHKQAEAYRATALELYPELEEPEPSELSDKLAQLNWSFDALVNSQAPPLRASKRNVSEAFNAIYDYIVTQAFLTLPKAKQLEHIELAKKLANWHGSERALVNTMFQEAKFYSRLDNQVAVDQLLVKSAELIVNNPDLQISLLNQRIQLQVKSDVTLRIKLREEQLDYALSYSAREYARLAYWLSRDQCEFSNVPVADNFEDFQKHTVTLLQEGSHQAAIYSFDLMNIFLNDCTNSDGSRNSIDLAKLKLMIYDNIGDPTGKLYGIAEVLRQYNNYYSHIARGGTKKRMSEDSDVRDFGETLQTELIALADSGLKLDALRI
ncbi:MAG: hypothetical protein OQK03_12790, partial [Colwellia sp.]|nr:hypothetical protein [Colwellia sp.]